MKLLLYCTKSKPYLLRNVKGQWLIDNIHKIASKNGKIVAECDYEVEEISTFYLDYSHEELGYETISLNYNELLEKSCLDNQQLDNYLYGENGYAIHIKNLNIFDKPKELSEYHISYYNKELKMQREKHIEKAPKNMCYVFDINDKYVFISIHPERLIKELNGECTIIVKKTVLKGMLENDKEKKK